MTKLLIKLFIKGDPSDPEVRQKYALLSSTVGIILNILLFIAKLLAGILAASVAVIADAFNNLSDAGSVVITFIGFRLALKPVDKEHPWGHGRLEYVSGFIVDMLIILVGAELLKSSVEKIISPVIPEVSTLTFVLLGAAVVVKLWLFFFYGKIAKIIHSDAIKASSSDSISDTAATSVVLISALVAKLWSVPVDGWAGLIVAGFILFTGFKAARGTIDLLVGEPPSQEFMKELEDFVLIHPSIVGMHDLMVHDYGPGRKYISFHAEVPAEENLVVAHDTIDALENEIEEKFRCIVTIHMDPIETDNELVRELRLLAENCAKETNETFKIHDVRITYGGKHINLIFDLSVPPDCKMSLDEAKKIVSEKISAKKENCSVVIKAEHPYS